MAAFTHAITVDAPPMAVWPWVAQLGAGRAGWYSYDHIDNGGKPSARRIIPQLQGVAVGQVLPALPGARDAFVVAQINPGKMLILVVPLDPAAEKSPADPNQAVRPLRVSWALVLKPLDRARTRLISRGRVSHGWLTRRQTRSVAASRPIFIERIYRLLAKLPRPLLLLVGGLGHYFMESRMLRGIKRRAEEHWNATVLYRAVTPVSVPRRWAKKA
jgi:hypothetical protein